MNKFKMFILSLLLIAAFGLPSKAQDKRKGIVIELSIPKDSLVKEVSYTKVNAAGFGESYLAKPILKKARYIYKFPVSEPLYIRIEGTGQFLAEPGDHVFLTLINGHLKAKGFGSAKYQLIDSIKNIKASVTMPSVKITRVRSEAQYIEWHDYLVKQLSLFLPVIDSYKNRLSKYAYNDIRAWSIESILDKFSDVFPRSNFLELGISRERMIELFDTKYKPLTDRYFPFVARYAGGTWKPVYWGLQRKHNFFTTDRDFDTSLKRSLLYLEEGKKVFKDRAREMFIYKVLFKELVKGEGFVPEVEAELDKYYAEPGFPEWKAFMKAEVLKTRERRNARSAPEFELTDPRGKIITKAVVMGKLAIFDFWFTGCEGCIQMAPAMQKLEAEFKNDTNVVFINVSIDKSADMWKKSISQGKYTSGSGINVYTGGKGNAHPMIRYYGISGYPSLVILDAYGRAIEILPKLDPRSSAGYQRMRDFISKQLVEMKDGPYLVNKDNTTSVYEFNGGVLNIDSKPKNEVKTVQVNTYQSGKQLKVVLKDKVAYEPSIYSRPDKLLVLSDIEGNFEAFARLLMVNKVIDESYNWTFGNGHLVFSGDMFDRGNQVTECLWLMYALEEKAKTAGGYVHFVLGNHEIMNLQGNHNYVQPKYVANAEKAGKKLTELYGEDSELGRWLRTKNIMEKIGDLLFVHGGLGLEFANAIKLPVMEINSIARPHYSDNGVYTSPDKNINMIFDHVRGPLWYRFYYEDSKKKDYINPRDTTQKFTMYKPTQMQLDSLLNNYGAKRIVTGHTIVADTISTHYNNKVINTDVPHAKGKSEALLIEGNSFYRVDDKGERKLLFRDEENSKTK